MSQGDTFELYLYMNPLNGGTVSYQVVVPTGRSAVLEWTLLGAPDSDTVLDSQSPKTITIQAASFGDVSDVALKPVPL